jgi:predicted phosphoribosyltransferase
MENIIFKDRRDAGQRLGSVLSKRIDSQEPRVVLGIPRGGIVVAAEVADALSAQLDVIIARKVRAPRQPELGIGAVVNGDHISVINKELARAVGATPEYLSREIATQGEEIDRRLSFYRDNRPALGVAEKTVIMVDDGIATGFTFRAALEGLRQRNPGRLVAAVPVAAPDSLEMVKAFADEVVCLMTPVSFLAVGYWYRNFNQVSDEEVVDILRRNWSRNQSE